MEQFEEKKSETVYFCFDNLGKYMVTWWCLSEWEANVFPWLPDLLLCTVKLKLTSRRHGEEVVIARQRVVYMDTWECLCSRILQ